MKVNRGDIKGESREVLELFNHLKVIEEVKVKDIHGIKERKTTLEAQGDLLSFISANKIDTIKLITSRKDHSLSITSPILINDFISFCNSHYNSHSTKANKKAGQPKARLLTILESGYFIVMKLKALGVTDNTIAEFLNVDRDTFTRVFRKVKQQWKKLIPQ